MNKYIPRIFGRSKPARAFLCSCAVAMLVAGLFRGSGLLAAEGPTGAVAATANALPIIPSAGSPAMDLPLSTWVGPGDVLRIKAYPDTGSFISGNYVILDSGFAVLPIIGLVQVTHLSTSELTYRLTNAYAKYLAYPTLQIEPLIHLSILGGFLRPGMYLVNPLHPLSNALSAAGGTVRDDGLKLLRWERNGAVLATNLTSQVESTQSLWAVGFKSGDQICITLRVRRDLLPVASFIVSSIISSATLAVTLLVFLK
jgi:protein involved in polysaccharide export with SLBB domain